MDAKQYTKEMTALLIKAKELNKAMRKEYSGIGKKEEWKENALFHLKTTLAHLENSEASTFKFFNQIP